MSQRLGVLRQQQRIRRVEDRRNAHRDRAMLLEPETVVNGCADPNANDYYRIEAKAGEKFVVTCEAGSLDSRMDASLVLTDAAGRELDRDRNNRSRDAVVSCTASQDGSYFLHVADFTFGGGHIYPYRLALTAAQHLEFAFPAAGQPGTPGRFTVYGRSLPGSDPARMIRVGNRLLETQEVEISLPAEGESAGRTGPLRSAFLPHWSHRLGAGPLQSNALPIGVASAPIVIEREEADAAQEVTVPCEIQGRFDRARDVDRFLFSAKKDQELWVEVVAERIGTSADSSLRIERATRSAEGVDEFQEVAANDDLGDDPGEQLFPLSCRDSGMAVKIPEDGNYPA